MLHREALNLRPPGHPDRSSSLNDLAGAVKTQFEQLGRMRDLEEAILLHREALHLTPPGHYGRLSSLNNLANAVMTQFEQPVGRMPDLEEQDSQSGSNISDQAWDKFELASDYIYASPTMRLRYTLTWTRLAYEYKHKSAGIAYRRALLLLEQCLTVFPTPELQHNFFQTVQGISELASDAVSWAIESGDLHEAVEVWEQGRGILWSKMRDYRYPIV
ncbi:hypothetical protein FA95DRAFT_1529493, partial [Auriscalpium vulgare]